jgi:hypothetical protein
MTPPDGGEGVGGGSSVNRGTPAIRDGAGERPRGDGTKARRRTFWEGDISDPRQAGQGQLRPGGPVDLPDWRKVVRGGIRPAFDV